MLHLMDTAFLFDLDGTLVDSVYQHVLAWREASRQRASSSPCGASIEDRHERRADDEHAAARDRTRIEPDAQERLQRLHAEAYNRHSKVRPLPGARELLDR